jgi:hypothetical protein
VGRADIAYWTDGGGQARLQPALRIFRNGGSGYFFEDTGGFLPEDLFLTGGDATLLGVSDIAVADVDGDGDPDIVTTGWKTKVDDSGGGFGTRGILPAGTRSATRILVNDGSGSFSDATDEWIQPGGDPLRADAVEVVDVDLDGNPDLVLSAGAPVGTGYRPLRILKTR